MAEDKQKKNKRHYDWVKDNVTRILIKLNHNTDTDILDAIADAPVKGTEIKRLVRVGIAAEKKSTPD